MIRIIFSLLLALSVTTTMAQKKHPQDNFLNQWQQIDSLITRGLPQSAAKIAENILTTAEQQDDRPNAIKAQLFLMGVDETIQENASITNIQRIDSIIQQRDGAEKAIWQSINAELYWHYYQRNRWTILNRTPLAGDPPADVATWDAATFVAKASELYQASILDSDPLKAVPVERYAPLVVSGKNTRHLRPTLYDLLAFRAIGFFENDEKDVIKPAYQFQIDGTLWFEDAERLAEVKVNPATPEALHFRALHTYQQVLTFHLNDEKPDALIDADLQRLAFVHRFSVHPDKDSLYRAALNRLAARYATDPASAQATYQLLRFDYEQSDKQTTDSLNRIQLLEQLDALIAKFKGSEGATKAMQLRHTITSKSLNVETEEVMLPQENHKALISYRNLDRAYFRLYHVPISLYNQLDRMNDETQTALLSTAPLEAWDNALPGSNDLYGHQTEIKINPLPAGRYLLVASATPDFAADSNLLHSTPFQVSSWSMVTANGKNGQWLVALHRKSGMPIRGAQVTFLENQWDSEIRANRYKQTGETRTDEDGRAKIEVGTDRRINRIAISTHNDTLITDGYFGSPRNRPDNRQDTNLHAFLFTDRGIYRPGQTIHFKGIVVKNHVKENTNSVIPHYETEVSLYDANNQQVTDVKVTTNEFGSFTGQFTAPSGGLTGNMRIQTPQGQVYFSVEEYKRPRFSVAFDTVKGHVALRDTVTVTGRAQAYAGNNIDGAEVAYRVVRRARFPYFWAFHRWGQPHSPEMEIANGTAQTKADGSFDITFTAIPDKQINPETFPVFTYAIYADVTDVNGETQSGNQQVNAGYRSIQLQATIAEQLDARDTAALTITTQNLNNVATPADVEVTVAPLQFPGKLYRKRLWEKPDRPMDETEYRHLFPDDEYDGEADHLNWPVADILWSTTVNTATQQTTGLAPDLWKQEGWHVITLTTTDPQGNEVTEKKYTYVVRPAQDARPQKPLLVLGPASALEPDSQLDLLVKTGFDSTYVLETNTDISPEFTAFTETRRIQRTISEEDRGGLPFSWLYVHNNRVYTANTQVQVPWSNRDLQLEWATHRDKLLSGEAEEWQLTIKGAKKDAVTAELLAGLYDASLDALKPHAWHWNKLSPTRWLQTTWLANSGFGTAAGRPWANSMNPRTPPGYEKRYDELLNHPALAGFGRQKLMVRGVSAAPAAREEVAYVTAERAADQAFDADESVVVGFGEQKEADQDSAGLPEPPAAPTETIPVRTNLQETAFFFPDLQTDTEGNVTLRFTMPEALTEWKLMAFAHTPDWKTGYLEGKIKTQKDLMVMPNLPRFLRQGDDIRFSAKVSNISAEALNGTAYIELLDATTLQPLAGVGNGVQEQPFEVGSHQSTDVAWTFSVADSLFHPVVVRISAKAGNFTDGEENTLPVITNRMLVTETLPLPVRGNESKTFTLDKLANTTSDTRLDHALTVEFTGNPAWYAVQALPYLMEYPYECAEQVFGRVYANALAAHIVDQAPRVKAIFEQWKTSDTTALLSNLEKNQELKSALLEETPWVMDAKNEREQKHRIARLFESHKLAEGLQQNLAKLAEMQLSDGSFPWFRGMSSNRYITQYIATGIARLQRLGVEAAASETANGILAKAVDYLDRQVQADHGRLLKDGADLGKQHLGYTHVHYLYMRSLLENLTVHPEIHEAYDFYLGQAATFWNTFNPYLKGQLALALSRADNTETAAAIMASLRETAVQSEEMGMYWKTMPHGYWWYEAPIEAQALLVEAFAEVASDQKAVDDLKVWLIKQKQTQHWKTTKATADAIYALLLQGSDWLVNEPEVTITLGTETIRSTEVETEAGTGYFKKRFDGDAVTADMGNISVQVEKAENEGVAWGAVYWQYFEDLDKITGAETPLSLRKQLYIQRNTDRGPVLEEISTDNPLEVGDKVTVRIELRVDRDMEYVHLKDMRAACFEPINVLSGHRYQGGLGYYESTRDAATNFFFDYLRKGTYVFEYPVFVAQAGDFSNGISTIQCMYAPEFSSHSEGIRVQVDE